MLGLDTNLSAIHDVFSADPLLAKIVESRPGIRLPGAWDPFEVAVRAVVGQQISVKGEGMMYYDFFDTGLIGPLTLVGDEAGLRHLEFENEKYPITIRNDWKKNPEFFKTVKAQLQAYFNGELKRFDIALTPNGTPFQLKVWLALRQINYGELVSYKSIAEAIGNPKAVRAVGAANGKNPIPIIVPCHRVIGSDGSLTGFAGGLETKKRLIDLERQNCSS